MFGSSTTTSRQCRADRYVPPPPRLAECVFNFYDWDVRPTAPESRQRPDAASRTLVLLSHADTDLLTLRRARAALPPDLTVGGMSLLSLRSDDQMQLMLDGELADARIIVLRVHGDLTAVPGIDRLERHCRTSGTHLLVISGTGEPRADFARVSTAPLDVLDAVTTYFLLGGERNVAECVRFVSDRLLLTGIVRPPVVPEHAASTCRISIRRPSKDWRQRAKRRGRRRPSCSTGHTCSRQHRIHRRPDRRSMCGDSTALPIFTSSLRAMDGDMPAALRDRGQAM